MDFHLFAFRVNYYGLVPVSHCVLRINKGSSGQAVLPVFQILARSYAIEPMSCKDSAGSCGSNEEAAVVGRGVRGQTPPEAWRSPQEVWR